jgi:predicted extracellular nuclease
MNSLKVATFNVENLFKRFKFRKGEDASNLEGEGWTIGDTKFEIHNDEEKRITGEAIKALDADVIAMQEVEDLDTVKRFRNDYLGGRKGYPFTLVIDGNDPRRIDVAMLSRYPLTNIQTYNHLWSSEIGWFVFARDCLVADVLAPSGFTLTLFVNHFKSMLDKKDKKNGRRKTRFKRIVQSQTVKQIVQSRFGPNAGDYPFIVLGDLNDYLETDDQGESGIAELVTWGQVVNVIDRLPEAERWTHYFKTKDQYKQLDYVLLSASLAGRNPHPPYIERRGLPKRAKRYPGKRFKNVGNNKPKASDHCPVLMELQF